MEQSANRPDDPDAPSTEQETKQKPKPALDLTNPRATMRAFLVAVQAALGDHPERIDDAVACLDVSKLEGETRIERARSLARRLHDIIDRQGVKLDDIPEDTQEGDYLFFQLEHQKGVAPTPEIRLARDAETGLWRFTAGTLMSIPALEATIQEKAKPQEPAESTVPAARRSPRATMATFLEVMNAEPQNLDQAVQCLDPTGQDPEAWAVRGPDLAHKLKNVIDKIQLVVLIEITDSPEGQPYVWHTSKTGHIVIGQVAEGDFKNEWRFTPQTLKTLDALYAEFEDSPIVRELQAAGKKEELTFGLWLQRQMPQWSRGELWHLQGWQWLALAMLLPLGRLIQILAAALATLLLRSWLRRRRLDIDREVQRRALRSSGAAVTVLFWLYVIKHLGLSPEALGVLLPVTKLALGTTAVWVGYRFVDILGGHIAADKDVQLTRFDDVLIPLLRKILRLVVVLVVVLFVLDWLGQKPTTVLGVLGVGGIALAFAAQDTLGNFFGSITVLFDRPFGIGDWIVIGDVEGMVERVGFRSTRVRTFYNSVVTIPNSKMVNTQVDNYGARRYRRMKVMLSITYSTPPEKIDALCEGIRELIRLHPYTRKDYYHVYFNKFAASSLDILVYTFFEAPDWGTELRERHRLFIDILRLADRLGVEFAFPTQTLWLERSRAEARKAEPVAITPGKDDPDAVGLDEAARVYEHAYGVVPVRRDPVIIDTKPRSKRKRDDTPDRDGGRG